MSVLAELLLGQLSGSTVSQLGDAIGSDGEKTQTALAAALPLLIGALSRNAAKPDGAQALHAALGRDHDGSVLDDMTRAFGHESQIDGEKILAHALGSRKQTVEAGVARTSGLDSGQATKLMATLAPIIMGALGRKQRSDGLDAAGLAGLLTQERQGIEQNSAAASLIDGLLDQDDDGSVVDDLGKLGAGLLKGFMRGN